MSTHETLRIVCLTTTGFGIIFLIGFSIWAAYDWKKRFGKLGRRFYIWLFGVVPVALFILTALFCYWYVWK